MKHIKLFEDFSGQGGHTDLYEQVSPGDVAIYVGGDGSDVTVLNSEDARKLIQELDNVDDLTVDYKQLTGDEKYVIWDPNSDTFDYTEFPDENGQIVFPDGDANYNHPDSNISSENWSIPLLKNRVVSVDSGQGNTVAITGQPVAYLLDKYKSNM